MKKLFISCPVRGRKIEDVIKSRKKMHEIAQIIFDQELEVIDSVMACEIHTGDTFDSLVHHLNCLKDADYFISVHCPNDIWRDCYFESSIAISYDIPRTDISAANVAPDIFEIEREYWDNFRV